MTLQFNPPKELIDAYMNRPSGAQLADQSLHDMMAAYIQSKTAQAKEQSDSIGTLSKLAENVDFSDPNTIKAFGGLFKKAGISPDVFGGSTPPTASTGTTPSPQANPQAVTPVEQSQQASLPAEHPNNMQAEPQMSPLIQASLNHPDHQAALGLTPEQVLKLTKTGGGRKKLAALDASTKFSTKTPITKEDVLKAGSFDPTSQMMVEPPAPKDNSSQNNKTFIGNDATGNPLFADKAGNISKGTVPTGGPVFPKSSTMPTSSTRGSAEFANTIIPHIQDMRTLVSQADQKGFIGPGAGRIYSQFLAGTVGSTGNPEADRLLGELKATDSLLKTGAMRVHFGAKGGQQMYDHFSELLNSGKQSAAMLNGSLNVLESFMQGYSNAGKLGGVGTQPSGSSGAEETKTIGGQSFVKRNGQWFHQ